MSGPKCPVLAEELVDLPPTALKSDRWVCVGLNMVVAGAVQLVLHSEKLVGYVVAEYPGSY